MTPEKIEREVLIEAPVERVWAVLTEAQHIGQWFGDAGAEIDLQPGGTIVLQWKEHGRYYARVEQVEFPRFFSFRGARLADAQPDDSDSTLVEFTLTPEANGTRLRVVESGFRTLALPEDEQAKYAAGNVEGWISELDELRDYIRQLPA